MLSEERKERTIELLKERNFLKISELIETFGVSHETIRRDLEELQGMGIARRVHGGAAYVEKDVNAVTSEESNKYKNENQAVASVAAKLVKPGMVIYIDNGRTMTNFVSCLKSVSNLTVVTPSLHIANEISSCRNIDLYILGGKLDPDEFTMSGLATMDAFRRFNVQYAFLSCGGLDPASGDISDFDEFGMPRNIIRERAEKVVLVLNSGKLEKRYLSNIFNLKSVDTVIIDSNISKEHEEFIRSQVPEVIIAPVN